MNSSKKKVFRWMLTTEVISARGIFNLRVFKNEDSQQYVGVLSGEIIVSKSTVNGNTKMIKECAYDRYESLGNSLTDIYDDIRGHVNLVADQCIDMREVEHR